jgi:hypothetical protein
MRVSVFTIAGFLLLGSTMASAEVPATTDAAPPPAAATTTTTTTTTTGSAETPAPAKTAAVDMDERVCKEFKITGQLIPGKPICHTRREWDEINRHWQEEATRLQNRSNPVASK